MTNRKPAPSKTAQKPASANENTEMPVIDRAEPESQLKVGIFAPNILQLPTYEQLLAVLTIMGLTTRPIAGQDRAGNLVDEAGNVIVPSQVRPFFQLIPVQITPAPAAQ